MNSEHTLSLRKNTYEICVKLIKPPSTHIFIRLFLYAITEGKLLCHSMCLTYLIVYICYGHHTYRNIFTVSCTISRSHS